MKKFLEKEDEHADVYVDVPDSQTETSQYPFVYDAKPAAQKNPYLIMGFWEFAIIATLMVAFFPWSLLASVIFRGLENTKYLVIALLHDLTKTLLAVLAVVAPIFVLLLWYISTL